MAFNKRKLFAQIERMRARGETQKSRMLEDNYNRFLSQGLSPDQAANRAVGGAAITLLNKKRGEVGKEDARYSLMGKARGRILSRTQKGNPFSGGSSSRPMKCFNCGSATNGYPCSNCGESPGAGITRGGSGRAIRTPSSFLPANWTGGEGYFGSPWVLVIGGVLSFLAFTLLAPVTPNISALFVGLGIFIFSLAAFWGNETAKNSLKILGLVFLGSGSYLSNIQPFNFLLTLGILFSGYFSIKARENEQLSMIMRAVIGCLIVVLIGTYLGFAGVDRGLLIGLVLITFGIFVFSFDTGE